MSDTCATAAFTVITDENGTRRIQARCSWLDFRHGCTKDLTDHSVYQLLGDLAPTERDEVHKLPILNVITCSAKDPSGREEVIQVLEEGQTVLVDWSRAAGGKLQLGLPRTKGKSLIQILSHCLTSVGPTDILPAPSASDLGLARYEPSFAEYNARVSGESVVTSFTLQLKSIEETDPPRPHGVVTAGLSYRVIPMTVRVEPLASIDQETLAWVTKEANQTDAFAPLSRFGESGTLMYSVDEISYKGGMSFVKQVNGEWIRYEAPKGGRANPLYWSRFNTAKKLTEFGLFRSEAKAEKVFVRKNFRELRDKMEHKNQSLSVTATYQNGDGNFAEEIVHLSQTPAGLICSESEGTITAPEFLDCGAVRLRKELPWTPEEELLVVLAGLGIP